MPGAIAGATGLGYDDPTDFSNAGAAKQNAYLATQTNFVWGQSPFVDITTHITFPARSASRLRSGRRRPQPVRSRRRCFATATS